MKSLPNVPELIPSLVAMKFPNEPIIAHSGEFEIISNTQSVKVNGDITFKWFPEVRITFSGHYLSGANDTFNPIDILLEQESALSLVVEGFIFGRCQVTRVETVEAHAFIRGLVLGTSHIRDITIPVEKVSFCIANLRNFNGSPTIENISEDKISHSNSRLLFTKDDYTITIDKIGNHKSAYDILSDEGGYIILYSGELTNANKSIKYNEIQDLSRCFSTFLSFLNGKRCSMLFLKGIFDNEVIWEDFTPRFTDPYRSVFSWPSQNNIEELNNLWQSFSELWQNKEHREFITASVHWYIEANSHSGFTEGSIIMTQTALELLYNWLVIEQKGLLAGKDAENISAANKIRLLLSVLRVPNQVPAALSNLSKLVVENQEIADGPDAFVLIRNAIVHSQESKRKKLMEIPTTTKYEALKLGLWYLELALLYSFRFEGIYRNRCSASKWAGSDEESVPWAK